MNIVNMCQIICYHHMLELMFFVITQLCEDTGSSNFTGSKTKGVVKTLGLRTVEALTLIQTHISKAGNQFYLISS